jgi:uncharacterized protein YbjT (DUF2867 family)
MESRKVLIVGALGKQGRATVDELLALKQSSTDSVPIHILALTRNTESKGAKALAAAHPSDVTLVGGDLKDAAAVFAEGSPARGADSLFLFTMPGTPEDKVGRAWVDAAVAAGVRQIVLSTVDRGGDVPDNTLTGVPHFDQKHSYEVYVREKAAELAAAAKAKAVTTAATAATTTNGGPRVGDRLYWTVLRPVAFLDNLDQGIFASVFFAAWATVKPDNKKLQFVSTRDIGRFAARAIADPEQWDGKSISLAGEEMTREEARSTFRRVVGQEPPQAWPVFVWLLFWFLPDVRKMCGWFGSTGFGADIAALRRTEPRMQDFETWLKESSHWKVKEQ